MRVGIKDTSWHYKWYMFLTNREPTNLCGYFWLVFLSVLAVVMVAGVVLGGGSYFLIKLFAGGWTFLKKALILLGILVAYFAVVISFSVGMGKLVNVIKVKWFNKPKVKKEGTFLQLTGAYLKAKKMEICPLVDVIHVGAK